MKKVKAEVGKGELQAALEDVSAGRLSIMECAHKLGLQDAGFLFGLLSQAGLELPRLSKAELAFQKEAAHAALEDCLIVQGCRDGTG